MRIPLIIVLCLMLFVSTTAMVVDWHLWKTLRADTMKAFQSYVCGFGLGATISPAWGFISYDPRIDAVDEAHLWPIPAWYSYSPDRGLSVSDFREITYPAKKQ